jgi:hypothetical protein
MKDSAAPLSSLNLPGRIQQLLEENGVISIEDLAVRIEKDPKSILAFGGIGPKTLLMINSTLEAFENEPIELYPEPVQSLGDQFKSLSPEESLSDEDIPENQEIVSKQEKKKRIKVKKSGRKNNKKPKKSDEKKGKKSDNKKGKKPDKKKDKKPDKKKDKKPDKKKGKKPDKKKGKKFNK